MSIIKAIQKQLKLSSTKMKSRPYPNTMDNTQNKKIASELASNININIEHCFTVRDVEIKQQTAGQLLPFSVDAWDGYVSPSGGFVNFARYRVFGINPKTNRRNKRIYDEQSEAKAIQRAEAEGLVGPFEIAVIPFDPPSDRQLAYAKDLGISIPEGACWLDISALISRVIDKSERPADEKTARQAHIHGVKFSRYHNWISILRLAEKLPSDTFGDFLASIRQ